MDHDHVAHRAEGNGPGYETTDARPRVLMRFGLFLIVFLALLEIGMLAVYRPFYRKNGPDPAIRAPGDIYDQLRLTRETAAKSLANYGWVDPKAGIVRIPIDRAMDLVASRPEAFKGKGPKSEAELNSHAGMPAEAVGSKAEQAKDSKPGETKDSEAKEAEGSKPKEKDMKK